ncbi:phosphatase PAP2 family protein [Sphingorhabdus sp.]|uniref:phosphatase PAP2 family protein n=1 Tax=Sphingorhabdus sp. TaxID=1902408 RepID=UPI0032B84CDF
MLHLNRALGGFITACKADALTLSVGGLFILASLAAMASIGIYGFPLDGSFSLLLTFAATAVFFGGSFLLIALLRERPESPIGFTRKFLTRHASWERLMRHVPLILLVSLFLPAFSGVKSSISLFATYSWDGFWIEADRMIHGMDAWRLIHPVVGYPFVTFVLSALYIVWLPMLLIALVYFSFLTNKPILRAQFLLTYFSCWAILGSLCAIAFASVGPCFVHPLVGREDFLPLMDYLDYADSQWPIWVIPIQDRLAAQLAAGSRELGAGITAMPSMHVSMAFLYWLAARHVNRWLGWAMFVYMLCILVASVHLAYHYAVDGYLSIILTLLIWKLCGHFAVRAHPWFKQLEPPFSSPSIDAKASSN